MNKIDNKEENKIATLAVDNRGATDWKFCCNQCWYWK